MTMTSNKVIGARQLCWDIIDRQMTLDMWGGVAYIHMRTPLFSLTKNKTTGLKTDVKPKVLKYHATQLVPMIGEDKQPMLYKSGANKGKPRMQGVPNPFWDFEANRPKVIKNTMMQVQIGFNWFEIMKAAQREGGFEPDYEGGTQQTWRTETRYIEVTDLSKNEPRKTVFFYRFKKNVETGEEKPFDPKTDNIYLACLTPRTPLPSMPTLTWYEELSSEPGVKGRRLTIDEQRLLQDTSAYKCAERDEDDIAEQQGHPDRPELNRFMFTPSVRNIVSLSAFGKKYRMPRRSWDDVDPVHFADVEGIEVENDQTTDPDEVRRVSENPGAYKKIPIK